MVTRVSGSQITISHNSQTTTANSTTILTQGLSHPSATGNNIIFDSSSRTFTSNQPSFKAYTSGTQINTNNTLLIFNNTSYAGGHNVGGHYDTSNGRFTAPIDGHYLFMMSMLTNPSVIPNSFVKILWRINGSYVHYFAHNHNSSWVMETGAVVFYLSANDYVDLYMTHGSGHYGDYSYFSGRLLG